MTTKHTPGPWWVEVNDTTTMVESRTQSIAFDVSNCDADLIAAAPDLLAACKAAPCSCSVVHPKSYETGKATVITCMRCAAIAKAEGSK